MLEIIPCVKRYFFTGLSKFPEFSLSRKFIIKIPCFLGTFSLWCLKPTLILCYVVLALAFNFLMKYPSHPKKTQCLQNKWNASWLSDWQNGSISHNLADHRFVSVKKNILVKLQHHMTISSLVRTQALRGWTGPAAVLVAHDLTGPTPVVAGVTRVRDDGSGRVVAQLGRVRRPVQRNTRMSTHDTCRIESRSTVEFVLNWHSLYNNTIHGVKCPRLKDFNA